MIARIDPDARRARLHRRHLAVLAAVASGEPVEDRAAQRELTHAGAFDDAGRLTATLAPLAVAAATAELVVTLVRLRPGDERSVEVRAGPDGVLVAPAEGAGEVALAPRSALARTLWRLLHLGPRHATQPARCGPLHPEQLVAPFTEGHQPGWLTELGVDPAHAVLDRVDLHTRRDGPTASLAVLDTGDHLWQLTPRGDGRLHLESVRPLRLFTALAAWQTRLAGGEGPPPPTDPPATVQMGSVTVAVPAGWERLDVGPAAGPAATPAAAFAARPPTGRFAVNLTVVPTSIGPAGGDPLAAAAALAAELPGGVAVDAPGGVLVAAHIAGGGDVVSLQRRLPGSGGVAVTYTCAVEQLPSWRAALLGWLTVAGPRPEA